MRLNKLFLCMLLVALPVAASAAQPFKPTGGAQTPVEIVASNLEYQRDKGLYVATGDVELKDGPRSLKAQRVTYNETNGDVFAQGNVVYQDPEQSVYSETLSLNVVTKQGVIEKGRIFVKQGNFYIRGDQIQKTGETTYVIQQGEFTTCGPGAVEVHRTGCRHHRRG
jgi:LPS-assembly protein